MHKESSAADDRLSYKIDNRFPLSITAAFDSFELNSNLATI